MTRLDYGVPPYTCTDCGTTDGSVSSLYPNLCVYCRDLRELKMDALDRRVRRITGHA